jgi:hypothetical protein
MTRGVIEWVPFRLADGATEDELVAASRQLQDLGSGVARFERVAAYDRPLTT